LGKKKVVFEFGQSCLVDFIGAIMLLRAMDEIPPVLCPMRYRMAFLYFGSSGSLLIRILVMACHTWSGDMCASVVFNLQ
jgi:hypothetical protein